MRPKILFILALTLTTIFSSQIIKAEEPSYYLCGPDEDGCPEGQEQYCACIPFNIEHEKKYCLNLDDRTCLPVSERPSCDEKMKFDTQGHCLATLMQSEPNPPCREVTKTFCDTHLVYLCDKTGNPDSCKQRMSNTTSLWISGLVHRNK